MPGMTAMLPQHGAVSPDCGARPDLRRLARRCVRRSGDTIALEPGVVTTTIAGKAVDAVRLQRQHARTADRRAARDCARTCAVDNALDAPGSVHWHGIRLDNSSDGAVGLTQHAGRAARFVPLRASLSRRRHLLVSPACARGPPAVARAVRQPARPVDRSGVFQPGESRRGAHAVRSADRRATASTPFGAESPTHALMGRFGNVLLVNGELALSTRRESRRGRALLSSANAASARIYNLSFGDARMKVVAGEAGKFEREEWVGAS